MADRAKQAVDAENPDTAGGVNWAGLLAAVTEPAYAAPSFPAPPSAAPPIPMTTGPAPGVVPPVRRTPMPAPPDDVTLDEKQLAPLSPPQPNQALSPNQPYIPVPDRPPGDVGPVPGLASTQQPPGASAAPALAQPAVQDKDLQSAVQNTPAPKAAGSGGGSSPNSSNALLNEQRAAGAADVKAAEGVVAAKEGEKAPAREKAEAEAEGLEDKSAQQRMNAQELADKRQQWVSARNAAAEQLQEVETRFQNFKFHDLWKDDMGTGRKVVSAIAMAFGTLGSGDKNAAVESLQAAIAKSYEKQKDELSRIATVRQWKREGVTDVDAKYKEELAQLQVEQAVKLSAVADKAQATLIRRGVPLVEAQNDTEVAKMRAAAAAVRQQAAISMMDSKVKQGQFDLAEAGAAKDRAEAQKARAEAGAKGDTSAIYDSAGNKIGRAPDPESARKLRGELDTAQQAYGLVNKLRALTKAPTGLDTTRARLQAQAELKALIPALKGLNRLTHEEIALFEDVVGGKADAVLGTGGKNLDRLAGSIARGTGAHLAANGIKPTTDILRRTLQGSTAPQTEPPPTNSNGADVTAAKEWLAKNPSDPNAAAIRDRLKAMGAL